MKHNNDPEKEKILDYIHHRRNVYRENDKSSRKSIHKNKRIVNKGYRAYINQKLINSCDEDFDEVQNKVDSFRKKYWRKYSDKPLAFCLRKKSDFSDNRLLKIAKKIIKKKYGNMFDYHQ